MLLLLCLIFKFVFSPRPGIIVVVDWALKPVAYLSVCLCVRARNARRLPLKWLPHGWCQVKLQPSRRVLCTPYNHAPCHFMQSHIRKVRACLSVTCRLYLWQNDRDLLHDTAVTRGWNGYRNKSQHRKLAPEKKILPPPLQRFDPRPFSHESDALTTELSPLPRMGFTELIDTILN